MSSVLSHTNVLGIPQDSKRSAADIISDLRLAAQKIGTGEASVSQHTHQNELVYHITTDVHQPTLIVRYNNTSTLLPDSNVRLSVVSENIGTSYPSTSRKFKNSVNNFTSQYQEPQEVNDVIENPINKSVKKIKKEKMPFDTERGAMIEELQGNASRVINVINKHHSGVNSQEKKRCMDENKLLKALVKSECKNDVTSNFPIKIKEEPKSDDDKWCLTNNITPIHLVSNLEEMKDDIITYKCKDMFSTNSEYLLQKELLNRGSNRSSKHVNRIVSVVNGNSESKFGMTICLPNIVTGHPNASNNELVSECNNDMKNLSELSNAMQNFAFNVDCYPCKYCHKNFSQIAAKEEHELSHVQKFFPCSYCEMLFHNFISKEHHEIVHFNENTYSKSAQKKYLFRFPNEIQFRGPVIENENSFQCGRCGKLFSRFSSLNDHQESHSNNIYPFPCKHCRLPFPSLSAKNDHEKTHVKEKKVKCDECGKYFTTMMDKARHAADKHLKLISGNYSQLTSKKQTSHVQNKKHKTNKTNSDKKQKIIPRNCMFCQKSFTKLKAKHQHIRDVHLNETFPCRYCGKLFLHIASKDNHEKNHIKQKLIPHTITTDSCYLES